jgi:hypothetical protein
MIYINIHIDIAVSNKCAMLSTFVKDINGLESISA